MYSFSALYLILMDLFLGFDIFKQFCYLAKCLLIYVKHTSMPNQSPQAYKTAYFIKENLIQSPMSPTPKNSNVEEPDITF